MESHGSIQCRLPVVHRIWLMSLGGGEPISITTATFYCTIIAASVSKCEAKVMIVLYLPIKLTAKCETIHFTQQSWSKYAMCNVMVEHKHVVKYYSTTKHININKTHHCDAGCCDRMALSVPCIKVILERSKKVVGNLV